MSEGSRGPNTLLPSQGALACICLCIRSHANVHPFRHAHHTHTNKEKNQIFFKKESNYVSEHKTSSNFNILRNFDQPRSYPVLPVQHKHPSQSKGIWLFHSMFYSFWWRCDIYIYIFPFCSITSYFLSFCCVQPFPIYSL